MTKRVRYSYNLPPEISGFVAIVTVSANPNNDGSSGYWTAASYLVTMTQNYDEPMGAVVDKLDMTVLFQPPGYLAPPNIVGLFFGTADTGSAVRPVARGGWFTVLWDNSTPTTSGVYSAISIQVLHAH